MINPVRIRLGDLKRLIEEGIISEEFVTEADKEAPGGETGDSLDAQVDRYFAGYESASKTAKTEGRDFRSLIKRLLEAEGDDAETDEDPSVGDSEAPKLSLDDISVEEFADSVSRMIENYDSLLEVRSTLLRRAINFLSKGYDEAVVSAFNDVMREQHGMEAGKTKQEVDDEEFTAPAASRAGPDSGGGAAA